MDYIDNKYSDSYFSSMEFESYYSYKGNDLGAIWSREATHFRLWAPTADKVELQLYPTGSEEELSQQEEGVPGACHILFGRYPMVRAEQGTWTIELSGDLNGIYYTYIVTVAGETKETVDPYAKAAGVNGNRGMVIDLSTTDPEGFRTEAVPVYHPPTDAVIYEVHVRDFSADSSSGMMHRGKFLAFTEEGTINQEGDSTGTDYLKELGVTHIHLLPVYDYATVDETLIKAEADVGEQEQGSEAAVSQYNWGYDPKNYNVPEGSYATDPYRGEVRIREFKQMIQHLHSNNIRVIMDVVYNHTYSLEDSCFQKCVPGYYYRRTPEGHYSNASGCGNETASERFMVRKFIVDSVLYWAKEYHVDGFRFDLMGIHDIETMNCIRRELNKLRPGILMYGEGWTGGGSPLPDNLRAIKANVDCLDSEIAAFSDDIRDGIKGSVFHHQGQGFVHGVHGLDEIIKFSITAATYHEQVMLPHFKPWAKEPTQTVNYVSAHDNLTLWDKLTLSTEASVEDRVRMNLLSAAIVLTSQGVPFFQAGEEFLRSKPLDGSGAAFEDNSYRSPDYVNSLKWSDRTSNKEIIEYYKGLISLRKKHSALRLTKAEQIRSYLRFIDTGVLGLIAYIVRTDIETVCVILNANREVRTVVLPEKDWKVLVKGKRAGTRTLDEITDGVVIAEPIAATVLLKE